MVSNNQRLIIRISKGTLSFSVVDPTALNGILYQPCIVKSGISMAANLREVIRDGETLSTLGVTMAANNQPRATVMVEASVLMVPLDDFREEDCETLYRHTFTRQSDFSSAATEDTILHTVIPEFSAVAVFGMNKDLKLVLDDHFTDLRIMPLTLPVWTHLYQRHFSGARQKLFAYFHDKKMEVFLFGQRRLKYVNTFSVGHAHDALYFLLYAWRQLGLNAEGDELHLVGDTTHGDWLFQRLRLYLKKVYQIQPSAEFNNAPITRMKDFPYDLMVLLNQ